MGYQNNPVKIEKSDRLSCNQLSVKKYKQSLPECTNY